MSHLTTTKKAIIFARVSTKRQEQEGLSLKEIQLPRMRKYAKEKGFEVVREFVFQETADKKMRVLFNEMVAFVRKNKEVEAIIAFRVDRITRNFRDAVAIDDLRVDYDKQLHFVDDRLIIHRKSSSNEMMHWDTKVFLAKQYLNRLKEDAYITKYSKLENGELPWKAPFGYQNITLDKNHKDVIPTKYGAEVVKQMFTLYSTGAYSLELLSKKICDDYNIKVSKSNLLKILRDKFYIGEIYDRETDKYYDHNYETLVTPELYEAVQDVLNGHSKRKFKYAGLSFIYRGLLRCKYCKCAITPEKKVKKQKNGNVHTYHYYHCTQRRGKHPCDYVEEKELDRQISAIFKSFKIPKDEIERIRDGLKESHSAKTKFNETQLAQYENAYNKLQKRLESYYDMLADGSITQEEFDQHTVRNRDQQNIYRQKLAQLQRADEEYYVTATYLLSLVEKAESLFAVATIEEKRQLIGLVCQNLFLEGKTVHFNLKAPFDTIAECVISSSWLRGLDSNQRPIG